MPGTNTIELYDKEKDMITTLTLYRIMSISHVEDPDEEIKYYATLRFCQPQEQRRDPTKRASFVQYKAVIPECFREEVMNAFNNDRYVLAALNESCIVTLVTLSEPKLFDVNGYIKAHDQKQPYRAIEGI